MVCFGQAFFRRCFLKKCVIFKQLYLIQVRALPSVVLVLVSTCKLFKCALEDIVQVYAFRSNKF